MKKVAIDFAVTQLETIQVGMQNYYNLMKLNHKNKDTKIASIKKIIDKIEKILSDNGVPQQSYTVFRGEGISSEFFENLRFDIEGLFNCKKIDLQHHPLFSEKNGHGANIIVVFDNRTENMWVVGVDDQKQLDFKDKKCYIQ